MAYINKEGQMQLEMFPSANKSLLVKKSWNQELAKNTRPPYERLIIFGIVFIITAVAFFSLGVEKGKHMVKITLDHPVMPINVPMDIQVKTDIPVEKKEEQPKLQNNKPDAPKTIPGKIMPAKGNYTIQVATYRKTMHAQDAINNLKNKGFKTFILPADKFVQLCVGKFLEQEEAKSTLKELKKTYADCFIRRI